MTPAGWVFMICSLTFVVSLISFCFYSVLTRPSSSEDLHSPVNIDTHDEDT
ncbi:MAG: hypothetical protein J5J06_17935 [Phycisphaerae bacterium]|nr:hypothetical protein [Phycisphaerae bacterium]